MDVAIYYAKKLIDENSKLRKIKGWKKENMDDTYDIFPDAFLSEQEREHEFVQTHPVFDKQSETSLKQLYKEGWEIVNMERVENLIQFILHKK